MDRRLQPRPQHIPDIGGKHRKQAELNRLNQEIRNLQEELQKLENTDRTSVVCEEFVKGILGKPDPLLASDQSAIRWFEQPAPTQSCCWIC